MKRLSIILTCICLSMQMMATTKVACVGNSITFGYLLPDREKEAYPAQLQEMLGEEYEVKNFGKSRSTLLTKGHFPYTEQEEFHDALDYKADIVIIALGTNDTDPRDWPCYKEEFIPDYKALIDSFRLANPLCKIYACKIAPIFHWHPRFESGTRDWQEEVRQCIEVIAKTSNVELIDLHTPLYKHPNLVPDAIHPNAEGAKILAKTVYQRITGNYGGLQLPILYTDNMVIQRNAPIVFKGIANAGEEVTIRFDKKRFTVKAASNGRWELRLPAKKESRNHQIIFKTKDKEITLNNVAIGEVWLCSGQSNMEFQLQNSIGYKEEDTKNENIRLFDMKGRYPTNDYCWAEDALDSVNDLNYYKPAKWVGCSVESARKFSAVAYHFGKILNDSLNVPIGLICNAVGGSPCESWIDRRTLELWFPAVIRDWKENDFIQDWVRQRAKKNITLSNDNLQRHPYEPCYLFESGILPLENYSIAGVIWYQGESNAHNIEAHERLFQLLVNSWRNYFGKNLPFYYVQLSSTNRPSWPWFRDSQRRLLNYIPNTGMAVTSDIGDKEDVHPQRKKEVGERLAALALKNTYKFNVIPSGPLFKKATVVNNKVVILFDYAEGLFTSDGESIRGFEVASEDQIYYPAKAYVTDGKISVRSHLVNKPMYVRYGWGGYTDANLVNGMGYPASTFYVKL